MIKAIKSNNNCNSINDNNKPTLHNNQSMTTFGNYIHIQQLKNKINDKTTNKPKSNNP